MEFVRSMYEAWDSGGIEAVLPSLASDIEIEDRGGLIDSEATYRGHDGARELENRFFGEFDDGRIDVEEALPGPSVVVTVRLRGRGKASGVEVELTQWHVWTVRDGQAVHWRIFANRQEALEAAGHSE